MGATALVSGGKDSVYSAHLADCQGMPVDELLVLVPSDVDSLLFHTPNLDLVELQATAWGKRFRRVEVDAEGEAGESEALRRALRTSGPWVVAGAIASSYQWSRLHRVCFELGRKLYTPLWGKEAGNVVRSELAAGLDIRFVHLAAEGLAPELAGERLDWARLADLGRHGQSGAPVHLAGEGGEFETLVVDAPFFSHRLAWEAADRIARGPSTTLRLRGAHLVPKGSPG